MRGCPQPLFAPAACFCMAAHCIHHLLHAGRGAASPALLCIPRCSALHCLTALPLPALSCTAELPLHCLHSALRFCIAPHCLPSALLSLCMALHCPFPRAVSPASARVSMRLLQQQLLACITCLSICTFLTPDGIGLLFPPFFHFGFSAIRGQAYSA
jgi:hypothetical protein